jgi:hypothetical protein
MRVMDSRAITPNAAAVPHAAQFRRARHSGEGRPAASAPLVYFQNTPDAMPHHAAAATSNTKSRMGPRPHRSHVQHCRSAMAAVAARETPATVYA